MTKNLFWTTNLVQWPFQQSLEQEKQHIELSAECSENDRHFLFVRIFRRSGVSGTDPAGALQKTCHQRQNDQTYEVEVTQTFDIIRIEKTFIGDTIHHHRHDFLIPIKFAQHKYDKHKQYYKQSFSHR